jgi:hypothetical protein
MGGHRHSDEELEWETPEDAAFDEAITLTTQSGPNWRWQRDHVRVVYQNRECLLNEKSVSAIFTVLKATQAIPSRVIGYRNGQIEQRRRVGTNGSSPARRPDHYLV